MKRDAIFTAICNYLQSVGDSQIVYAIHDEAKQLLHEVLSYMDPAEVHKIKEVAKYKFEQDLSSEEIAERVGGITPEEVLRYERLIEEILSAVYLAVIVDYREFLFQMQQSIFDMLQRSSAVIVVGDTETEDTDECTKSDDQELVEIESVMQVLDKYRTTYKIGKVIKRPKPRDPEKQVSLFDLFGQN